MVKAFGFSAGGFGFALASSVDIGGRSAGEFSASAFAWKGSLFSTFTRRFSSDFDFSWLFLVIVEGKRDKQGNY